MEAIKTINLTKHYGKVRGITDLNLTVEEGEFFGFIGPNGAGKSTTMRTLLGLIAPTGGSARIFGKDVVREKEEILRRVGYMPSETVFYPGMRVRDILRLSADLRKEDCREEAGRLCERLKLEPSRKADELSFGNRKKAAIVCALQHKPELLILDEPTSGLDPLMQHEFFRILHERNREGAAIFLSGHVLSEIRQNCTRAAVIREGRIIACDSVEKLFSSGAKRVTVQGTADLRELEGIRDRKENDTCVSFLYGGDMTALLHTLASGRVSDLTVTEPELEEIFLHYYESEENGGKGEGDDGNKNSGSGRRNESGRKCGKGGDQS